MSSRHIAGLHDALPPNHSSDPGDVVDVVDAVLELKRSQGDGGVEDGTSSGASTWLLNVDG